MLDSETKTKCFCFIAVGFLALLAFHSWVGVKSNSYRVLSHGKYNLVSFPYHPKKHQGGCAKVLRKSASIFHSLCSSRNYDTTVSSNLVTMRSQLLLAHRHRDLPICNSIGVHAERWFVVVVGLANPQGPCCGCHQELYFIIIPQSSMTT